MKKLLLGLLLLLTLTACGGQSTPEPPESEGIICVLAEPAPPDRDGLHIFVEREVYAPSLTTFTYFIYNHTDETVEFGEDYRVQRLADDGSWVDLTPREDWGFTCIGLILKPGGEMSGTCTLDRYEEMPAPGSYRLVKPLGDREAEALFALGDSPYTAETPYGFGPLEDLPEDYRAASADCVVFLKNGMKNPENLEAFLHKSRLGAPCQLRTVRYRGEGTPIVTDVIYESGHFLRRERRDGAVTEQRFSYLVTDGQDLYLSNGVDWASGEKYRDNRAPLLLVETPAELIDAVEVNMKNHLRASNIRYQILSADGNRRAFLAAEESPTAFAVNWQRPGEEGTRGEVYDLRNWDGLETAITGLVWREDGTLLLTCETTEGGSGTLCFDPETERLTTVELCGLPLAEDGQ